MRPYIRKVNYYETDMMGVVHHSNYIRWMEEARIDFLEQLGFPYSKMEAEGVISPVKAVSCEYRRPCRFGDEITIDVFVGSFNGVVLEILYEMRSSSGDTVCTARSEHAFLTRDGHIVRVKKELPEFYSAMTAQIRKNAD